MQRFWYHSPVRFYKTIEELEDMTNPQNTQYFGHVNTPYPLEVNSYHRFLIPNYQNEVASEDLQLWLIGDDEVQVSCEFGIVDGKLFRVTFISFEEIQGHFEIRTESETLFYSNCVKFLNSSDNEGRKFIRIATNHNWNRGLFNFAGDNNWIITNIPAYCLGQFDIDEDVSLGKSGKQGSTTINDAWLEENVKYEFEINGDNNILSFISIHSTNNDFYIDGTKRTRKEKPEYEEFSPTVTMKFSNQKNENGMNIFLDEDFIFSDAFRMALGNGEKTHIYTYNDNKNAIPTE